MVTWESIAPEVTGFDCRSIRCSAVSNNSAAVNCSCLQIREQLWTRGPQPLRINGIQRGQYVVKQLEKHCHVGYKNATYCWTEGTLSHNFSAIFQSRSVISDCAWWKYAVPYGNSFFKGLHGRILILTLFDRGKLNDIIDLNQHWIPRTPCYSVKNWDNSPCLRSVKIGSPETCENWLDLENSYIYYAHQSCEIYQILPHSLDFKAPGE